MDRLPPLNTRARAPSYLCQLRLRNRILIKYFRRALLTLGKTFSSTSDYELFLSPSLSLEFKEKSCVRSARENQRKTRAARRARAVRLPLRARGAILAGRRSPPTICARRLWYARPGSALKEPHWVREGRGRAPPATLFVPISSFLFFVLQVGVKRWKFRQEAWLRAQAKIIKENYSRHFFFGLTWGKDIRHTLGFLGNVQ